MLRRVYRMSVFLTLRSTESTICRTNKLRQDMYSLLLMLRGYSQTMQMRRFKQNTWLHRGKFNIHVFAHSQFCHKILTYDYLSNVNRCSRQKAFQLCNALQLKWCFNCDQSFNISGRIYNELAHSQAATHSFSWTIP